MQRRQALQKIAALGAATATTASFAAPAVITQPAVQWRLASSFPKSLDTIYGAGEMLSKRVAQLTDGKFQIRVFAGGELVPGLQVLDAVSNGTVECGHTAGYYYVGKSKAFAFDTCLPFGLTARQQNAWYSQAGGQQLLGELFKQYNIVNFAGGNTGAQMGGWFRKPVNSLKELQGIKMRIPGIGGEIMSRLGVIPQTIAGADIYPALERGAIDASEWVGPYDDEKLGLYKVAKHYYFPGWWEAGPQLSFYVNQSAWAKLPKAWQSAFEVATMEANQMMLAAYDARNPQALIRLMNQHGVVLHRYPDDVMQAGQKAAFALYDELSAADPMFKKIYGSWKSFRRLSHGWTNLAETSLENFMYKSAK